MPLKKKDLSISLERQSYGARQGEGEIIHLLVRSPDVTIVGARSVFRISRVVTGAQGFDGNFLQSPELAYDVV